MQERRPDYLTANGARALAQKIETYWALKGARVKTRVEPLREVRDREHTAHVVRSDMVNGEPSAA